MGSLFDYLNWRGDLSFSQAPMNEVDNLIFSLISYIDFGGIVPFTHNETGVSMQAAANAFFSKNPNKEKISLGVIIPKEIIKLLSAVKDTKRFRSVGMRAYVNDVDLEKEKQFSAVTFIPDKSFAVVAFRGTDDTIVGWKENLNMSFLPVVPAQLAATDYLNQAADCFNGALYVTGHSKGGNLSVYAAVHCREDVKSRILMTWNNDGPGFHESLLKSSAYLQMRPKICSIVPQTSTVGMLLAHDDNYEVIKSRQAGLLQHNGLTWEVLGSRFVHLKNVTAECLQNDKTVNQWIREMTPEQREEFSDSVYRLLSANNALTLTQLVSARNQWGKKAKALDPKVHQTIQKMLSELISISTKNMISSVIPMKKDTK